MRMLEQRISVYQTIFFTWIAGYQLIFGHWELAPAFPYQWS